MIYIHSLNDLSPKSTEVEVVKVMRELKRNYPLPLTEEKLDSQLITYFMSDTDKFLMDKALDQINPVIYELKDLLDNGSETYSKVNIQRAINILDKLREALTKNILYSNNMIRYKGQTIREFTYMINQNLKFKEEENANYNKKLSDIFERMLRHDGDFYFNAEEIVNEGEVQAITGLYEGMKKGYLFHVSLDEELKKLDFSIIKNKLSAEDLQKSELLTTKIEEIKRGIVRAYEHNMRMIEVAIILYSYIRIVKENNSL